MKKLGSWLYINKKRIVIVITIIALFFMENYAINTYVKAEPKEWQEDLMLYSTAAVLMDADTGRILYGENEEDFMANASTTKIMTCILALEYAMLEDEVEISSYAASMPEVKMYVKTGEHYTMKDLLYALMLESYNDVAVAIAEHIGGNALHLPETKDRTYEESQEAVAVFAAMMNEKATKIGCINTHFITPNGLDATEITEDGIELSHGTTAADLALIMAYCMEKSNKNEEFLTITQSSNYTLMNVAKTRSFSCTNHNTFLTMMEGAKTGKTGFTNKAGYCYVGGFELEGKRFTIALLACGWPSNKTYKWSDAKKLYTYGLEQYDYYYFDDIKVDESQFQSIRVEQGQTEHMNEIAIGQLELLVDTTANQGILLHAQESIEVTIEVKDYLVAPVEAGCEVGKVIYRVENIIYRSDNIVLKDDFLAIDFKWCFQQIIEKYFL